ncbi:MAG TPA: hypothetical protein PLM86_04925 [Bacteroidales bacterium]|nr:hypothetical protein [Bacteroidales bacterium]HOR11669.1 hypothetical protein [Bacteroidales bacterium]HOZ19457.1 hypothetical protein [Bacteroidales bacterium]HPB78330.1 hypothetical protein [Bacteroidales bacterium]HPK39665.1 hypothetical protein [Bacteroidales bacterium]
MKPKRATGYIVLFLLTLCISCTKQPVSFLILHTSDLHGHFDESMAGMAGYIKQQRTLYGKRLLLFDTGDHLQGTPGLYYYNHADTTGVHLGSAFFNWFSYTAIAVGNHDIEAGRNVFSRVYRQMEMPVLSANIVHESSGEPFFRKTQQYGQKPIAVLLHTLESRVAMDGPSRWLDEVHRGQLEIAGADSGIRPDVSFASAIP